MLSRRNRAKVETRAALAEAGIEILCTEGLAALSADSIARRAGVSRRTFFNYFPTTDAVLAEPSMEFMQVALHELETRPLDEPLTSSLTIALTAADPELLDRFAAVVQACGGDPVAERIEREVWDQAEGDIAALLRRRLPADAPPLQVQVLSACVLAAGRAAILSWIASLPTGHDGDLTVTDHSTRLREALLEALSYLDQGLTASFSPQPPR